MVSSEIVYQLVIWYRQGNESAATRRDFKLMHYTTIKQITKMYEDMLQQGKLAYLQVQIEEVIRVYV